jgi:glycosyltransferase involved in cell wall biosynthesis
MRFLCLCPTYLRPHLVANALACFEAQDHPAELRRLLIYDDAGQLANSRGPTWVVISTRERCPSLTAKYNAMLAAADLGSYDAVALMDDDDIYGPQWLSSHAQALANGRWSHPRNVWSLYRPIAKSDTEPGQEPSGGRFWAAAAIRRDLLQEVNGFVEITRPTFDQEHLQLWQIRGGDPSRPDDFASPQYVYGWSRAPRHVSLEMGDVARWYDNYAAHLRAAPIRSAVTVKPHMDEQSTAIHRRCWPPSARATWP